MEIAGFDWDEGNQAKCLIHGVTTGDIEALFSKPVLIVDDPHDASRETVSSHWSNAKSFHFCCIYASKRKNSTN